MSEVGDKTETMKAFLLSLAPILQDEANGLGLVVDVAV